MCGAGLTGAAQETVASAKEVSKTSGTTSKSSITPPKKTAPGATHSKAGSTASSKGKSKYVSSRRGKRKTVARGQQKIDPERAQEIQEALIREHYLSGEAAGTWNQVSEDAMRRYQADHGWQSKTVPDSRALISLGLGPSHDHLLNPDSAMTSQPAATHGGVPVTAPLAPVSSSVPAAKIQPDPASPSAIGDSSGPR